MLALDSMYASPDAAGLQHMLLCKVLCGRQEIVKDGGMIGSSQFEPSSLDFDTGVDDLERPHRFLIWASKVNTHVLPLHVVSVRRFLLTLSVHFDGCLSRRLGLGNGCIHPPARQAITNLMLVLPGLLKDSTRLLMEWMKVSASHLLMTFKTVGPWTTCDASLDFVLLVHCVNYE